MNKSIKDLVILWDETKSPSVKVVSLSYFSCSNCGYSSSWGGCNREIFEGNKQQRILLVFQYAMRLILDYGLPPKVVDKAFQSITEYDYSSSKKWSVGR